jgi:hypothetical protein
VISRKVGNRIKPASYYRVEGSGYTGRMTFHITSIHSGAVTVSPTLLYLVTAVLQAAATKAADSSEILAYSPPVLAALDGLQALVSMRSVIYLPKVTKKKAWGETPYGSVSDPD